MQIAHRPIGRRLPGTARLLFALVAAGTVAASSGCASTRKPPDDVDLRLEAASHAFGGRYEYLVVHSSGDLLDRTVVGLGTLTGPSAIARDLATRLIAAERGELRILVTGPDRERTLQTIRDAFGFHRNAELPGLEFLFLGEPRDAAEVRALVESVGGRFRFAPFEG